MKTERERKCVRLECLQLTVRSSIEFLVFERERDPNEVEGWGLDLIEVQVRHYRCLLTFSSHITNLILKKPQKRFPPLLLRLKLIQIVLEFSIQSELYNISLNSSLHVFTLLCSPALFLRAWTIITSAYLSTYNLFWSHPSWARR